MAYCGFVKADGKTCRIPVKKGACHIHRERKNCEMFKKELSKLHNKLREQSEKLTRIKSEKDELQEKLDLIEKVDLYKQQLTELGPSRHISRILKDERLKPELKEILGVDFQKSKQHYYTLVDQRNKICHPYTMAHIFSD
jgi:predicted nuclease with TOPRIM domain